MEENVPVWAQELIREVTILNERLPNHIDTTERRIDALMTTDADQEKRIRVLEQFRWMILGFTAVAGLLGGIFAKLLGV